MSILILYCNCANSILKSNLPQCSKHLRTYLRTESNVHQVVTMFENHSKMKNKIMPSILTKNTPVLQMDFQNFTKHELQNSRMLQFINKPEHTTLFVIAISVEHDTNMSKLASPIDFIRSLSYNEGHPKCLFLIYSKRKDLRFKTFLMTMWQKRFLDVTVIHIVTGNNEKNEIAFLSSGQFTATIHQYNPYFEKYSKKFCSSRNQLFPEKLRDLHMYKMKYGTYNQPMINYVKKNSTGYPVEMKGKIISFAKLLAEVMNFELVFVRSNVKAFGRFDCHNKSMTTGYCKKLLNNEIQLSVVNGMVFPKCLYGYLILGKQKVVVLVPILKEKDSGIEGKFLFSLLVTVSILAMILMYILIRIMKFDHRYWRIMYIIQIMLQLPAPQEPNTTRERLIFCYLLIISSAYSSFLFGALTGLEFAKEKELIVDTIKDVYASDLQPISFPGIDKDEQIFGQVAHLKFLRKHLGYADFINICLLHISKHKNISCTMQEQEAKIMIENTRNKNDEREVKIVKEPLFHTLIGINMETNSPYSRRFKYILQKATEAGLVVKWEKDDVCFFKNKEIANSSEKIVPIKERKLLLLLFGVSALGFSLSFVVFVLEIIVFKMINFCKT